MTSLTYLESSLQMLVRWDFHFPFAALTNSESPKPKCVVLEENVKLVLKMRYQHRRVCREVRAKEPLQ